MVIFQSCFLRGIQQMTYRTSFPRNNFLLSPTNNLISSFIDLFLEKVHQSCRRWSLGLDSCYKMQISVSIILHTDLLSEPRLRTFEVFENPPFPFFLSLFLFPFSPLHPSLLSSALLSIHFFITFTLFQKNLSNYFYNVKSC